MTGSAHRLQRVLPIVLGCVLLDQATKTLARLTLSPLISRVFLNGKVRFVYAENTGIVQSIGSDLPDDIKFGLFTLLPSFLFLTLFLVVLIRKHITSSTLIALSLIVGGGLSNLLDRLVNEGAVIDFVYLVLWGRVSGIFNLADVAISAGSMLLIVHGLRSLTKLRR